MRRLALSVKVLRGIHLRLDRGDDGLSYLVLYCKDVSKAAVVTVSPELAARRHIAELGSNAHEIAAPTHAALHHVIDAEFRSNLRHGKRLALEGEGRVARDDEEPANFRQRRDNVLADAVGKILLLLFAAHVGEGEDGDGRLFRARLSAASGPLPFAGCATLLAGACPHAHGADEADAPTRDGADQFLLLAVVAHRPARGV